jgi:hypothetical protein
MAIRKTLNTRTVNGNQVTPGGDASVPVVDNSWEGLDNLDGSIDYKYNPERDNATFPITLNDETRKVVVDAAKITGWSLTATFRDETTVQLSNCAIVSIPSLDGDGVAEIEVHGSVRWL